MAVERLCSRDRKVPDRLVGLKVDEATEILANADSKLETVTRILTSRGTKVAEVRTDVNSEAAVLFETLFSGVKM